MAEDMGKVVRLLVEQQRILMEKMSGTSTDKANVPSFPCFDKSKDRWDNFRCRLNQHFDAYNVTDENKKRAYFLSWVGADIFELLRKLCNNEDVSTISYSNLIEKLDKHFEQKTHVLAARYQFNITKMMADQSYAQWIAELRGISKDCRYTCHRRDCNESFVDNLIRDMIILHTPHDRVRNAALQHVNPTLEEVLKIAEAYEITRKSVKVIKGEEESRLQEIQEVVNRSARKFIRKKHNKRKSCPGCGFSHRRENCKFLEAKCNKCGKIGHIASVCWFSKANGNSCQSRMTDRMSTSHKEDNRGNNFKYNKQVNRIESILNCEFYNVSKKMFLTLHINNIPMDFLLDTGATCSMIGLRGYAILKYPQLKQTSQTLKGYGNIHVPVKGLLNVQVLFNKVVKTLPLLVTNTEGGNIFGLDWFEAFNFIIKQDISIINENKSNAIDVLCQKYSKLFKDGLGKCNSFQASLHLKPQATPKFFKPRQIPFSQLTAVKEELDRLVTLGVLKSVSTSEWASPIVLVPKPNGKLRICCDFKVTVNSQLEVEQYPIPRAEELFYKLQNGKVFSKIDLADAYLQIELEETSKKILVINTPYGLFSYQRLPFGVASDPAIFQKFIEQLINGINGCANYLDDIIVTGENEEEHIKNLSEVFSRLESNGLKCNLAKCSFFENEVKYLGYIINKDGICPSESGVEAIKNLPEPKNLEQLQSFMGKVNYYNKFIKDFAHIAGPINILRKKNVPFKWEKEQKQAYHALKQCIVDRVRLVHYNAKLPIVLAADASSYGIGAVLSHTNEQGIEVPIAFASKTLTDSEKNYSQIEKEALSIIFGVKKFHQYLYGRKFELLTDHKPLVSIFHPNKQLPVMTIHRLQRWGVILMNYNYTIRYRCSSKHANADALSRLPRGPDIQFDKENETCMQLEDKEIIQSLNDFPINANKIRNSIENDKECKKICNYICKGWPDKLDKNEESLITYFIKRHAISLYKGIPVLHSENLRVIIPSALRENVMKLLHEGHWGIVRMKQMARRYCWWPNMDNMIKKVVDECESCQQTSVSPIKEFSKWPDVNVPWERIHLDFAGPFHGSM